MVCMQTFNGHYSRHASAKLKVVCLSSSDLDRASCTATHLLPPRGATKRHAVPLLCPKIRPGVRLHSDHVSMSTKLR